MSVGGKRDDSCLDVPAYTKRSLEGAVQPATSLYRKKTLTAAVRHEGPFECVTSEGSVARCEDGYLAVDQAGHPYPVNKEEFERTYERVVLP